MKKTIVIFFLTLVVVFIAVMNYAWLKADNTPQRWDEARHLSAAASFYRTITRAPSGIFREFISSDSYYPPLVPFMASFLGFTGTGEDNFTYSMIFFLALLAVFVFLFARLELDALSACAAAAITITYPLIFSEAHYFMLDLPLSAFFIMALYLLKRSDSFNSMGFTAAFGAACGLGLLIKWTFLFYILPALAVYIYEAVKDNRYKKGVIVNLAYGAAFFAAIAAPWYLYNFTSLIIGAVTYVFKRGAVEHLPPVLSIPSVMFYPNAFWQGVTPFYCLLFLAGAALMAMDKGRRKLLVIFVAALVIFAFIPNKKDRYIMPLLPMAAVITSYLVFKLRTFPKTRTVAAALLVAFSLVNYVFATCPLPFAWPYSKRPSPDSWKIREFLDSAAKGRDVTLAVIPDAPYMNNANYRFYAENFYPHITVTGIYNFPMFTDYFIIKTGGDMGPDFSARDKREKIVKEAMDEKSRLRGLYEKVCSAPLPDGSIGELYRRKRAVAGGSINTSIGSIMSSYLKDPLKFSIRVLNPAAEGRADSVEFTMKEGLIGDYNHKDIGLKVRNVDITVNDLLLLPPAPGRATAQLLNCGGIILKNMEVRQEDLESFIVKYAKNVKGLKVSLMNGCVNATAVYGKMDAAVSVKLYNPNPGSDNSDICFKVVRIKAGFLPIPAWLVNFLLKDYNPLLNRTRAPIKIKYNNITCDNGVLRIQ